MDRYNDILQVMFGEVYSTEQNIYRTLVENVTEMEQYTNARGELEYHWTFENKKCKVVFVGRLVEPNPDTPHNIFYSFVNIEVHLIDLATGKELLSEKLQDTVPGINFMRFVLQFMNLHPAATRIFKWKEKGAAEMLDWINKVAKPNFRISFGDGLPTYVTVTPLLNDVSLAAYQQVVIDWGERYGLLSKDAIALFHVLKKVATVIIFDEDRNTLSVSCGEFTFFKVIWAAPGRFCMRGLWLLTDTGKKKLRWWKENHKEILDVIYFFQNCHDVLNESDPVMLERLMNSLVGGVEEEQGNVQMLWTHYSDIQGVNEVMQYADDAMIVRGEVIITHEYEYCLAIFTLAPEKMKVLIQEKHGVQKEYRTEFEKERFGLREWFLILGEIAKYKRIQGKCGLEHTLKEVFGYEHIGWE